MSEIKYKVPENFAVEEADAFREKITQWLSEGITSFVLDFSHCMFIDSTGLGVLVTLHKKCGGNKHAIKLLGVKPQVKRVFELTRLDGVFDMQE